MPPSSTDYYEARYHLPAYGLAFLAATHIFAEAPHLVTIVTGSPHVGRFGVLHVLIV